VGPSPTPPPTSHYFSPGGDGPSRPATVRLELPDRELTLRTDRAVFSGSRVDPGTTVLLRAVPDPPPAGHVLDLGCGYGPIALTLAARAPGATVWAIDVNERARALAVENAAAAGLANVRVAAPDDVPDDVRFAEIWSNPPIRVGKPVLHALLTRWLGRLDEGGRALLVVQRHLGADSLHRWLAGEGWAVERLASRKGYRVLSVRR
jgi:16S rRNA (guanine1207-N2)-methyltransferase